MVYIEKPCGKKAKEMAEKIAQQPSSGDGGSAGSAGTGGGGVLIGAGCGASQAVRPHCRYSGPWTELSFAITSNAWMLRCPPCGPQVLIAVIFGKLLPPWLLLSRARR